MATTYAARKERARQEAIDWQSWQAEQILIYGELADAMAHFEALGRRYGLIQEFRENAII